MNTHNIRFQGKINKYQDFLVEKSTYSRAMQNDESLSLLLLDYTTAHLRECQRGRTL